MVHADITRDALRLVLRRRAGAGFAYVRSGDPSKAAMVPGYRRQAALERWTSSMDALATG